MKQDLIIFGAGKIAEAATFYFERDSNYSIIAYVCDDQFIKSESFLQKPLVPLSKAIEIYVPGKQSVFVAVGYQGINSLRKTKYNFFREKGFDFASYRSPYVPGNFTLGKNSIVMDGAIIQPCVSLGDNVFVWGGTMVGHHAEIGNNVWLTGGCMVGGITKVGEDTFVGLGAMIGHEIIIGGKCMLGAGTIACKSLKEGTVLVAPNTEPHRLNSDQFTRMSTCFKI